MDEEVGVRLAEQHLGVDEAVLDRQTAAVAAWLKGLAGPHDPMLEPDPALLSCSLAVGDIRSVLEAAARGEG